jgi:FSR family fosmidomycin resistance protein-like MFS transporter
MSSAQKSAPASRRRVDARRGLSLFVLMLLAEGFKTKLVLLGLLGFANAGWYAIIKAKLYDEMPGQSGMVAMMLGNVFGLAGCLFPLALGAYAEAYGLGSMMWLLALGPAALLTGLLTVKEKE